ncbi:hypothetical protein CC85DRAFT_184470 [Cutaneotrichosporon oleaginosum]|uniref:Uncharacterized protein n=1 Tax=Cutaneotrichosporon oleaginosum TaxID=879819 RepID=A0A0J0XEZ3_9TREE|nr:uncharacterized protein CC85DRAFT_184470 [Cutaneotrichosporon oleaginosum]KLT39635.1 hypothetical protein CC85DRAFT_184470 [Cutaneotrichosporon oleaginosum]TXT05654.1 hypothetical protein COLE_06974 [Cutaneotrichosporon oleaginosum]
MSHKVAPHPLQSSSSQRSVRPTPATSAPQGSDPRIIRSCLHRGPRASPSSPSPTHSHAFAFAWPAVKRAGRCGTVQCGQGGNWLVVVAAQGRTVRGAEGPRTEGPRPKRPGATRAQGVLVPWSSVVELVMIRIVVIKYY